MSSRNCSPISNGRRRRSKSALGSRISTGWRWRSISGCRRACSIGPTIRWSPPGSLLPTNTSTSRGRRGARPPRRAPLPGVVHAVRVDPSVVEKNPDPFGPAGPPVLLRVPPLAKRITAQHGLFSLHREPNLIWDLTVDSRLAHARFEIPHASKSSFRMALDQIGFNRQRLMVDLEGLCATLAWRYRNGRI